MRQQSIPDRSTAFAADRLAQPFSIELIGVAGEERLSTDGTTNIVLDITPEVGTITFSMLQDVQSNRIVGRTLAGPGSVAELTIDQVLNMLPATRGAVMYKGATAWSALLAGTSGYVLTTQGPGADPIWTAVVSLSGTNTWTALQTFSAGINVTGGGYQYGGNILLQGRASGWSQMTGTASRAALATWTAPAVSSPPTQAEVQALSDYVRDLSRIAKALIDDIHAASGGNVRLLEA